MSRPRLFVLAVVVAPLVAVVAIILIVANSSGSSGPRSARAHDALRAASREAASPARLPAGTKVLTVGRVESSPAIPAGFVGLSLEYSALPAYAGTDPAALDPVFVQLIRNLNPGQAPILRIGGDSTDLTWWPVPGVARPAGVNYTITPDWIHVVHALATTLGAKLILGINLEADSGAVAAGEANALVNGIGRSQIEGLELGNEPELYAIFTWDGSHEKGRPPGWNFADYNRNVLQIGAALPKAVPLAGPAIGAPEWFPNLATFLSSHPRVVVATLHRYPLQLCFVPPGMPNYPTIAHLLSTRSSLSMADTVVASVKVADAHHIPLRVDEMNTISCGTDPAVADSFASALWVISAMFQMDRVGVAGVNIHSYPGATYQLFKFSQAGGHWHALVEPEYYGMMMFAQAAPPGSRLLSVSGAGPAGVKAYATRATDGSVRVVAINEGTHSREIAVRLPGATGAGTLERLTAPSLTALGHVTLGGQTFGNRTTTGVLAGRPTTDSVAPSGEDYVFRVPASSATLLTVPAG